MEFCYSIEVDSNETILEKIIIGEKSNLNVLVAANNNKQFKEIYGIEFNPKSLDNGIFVIVIYEERDSLLYLSEVDLSDTTYKKALERLESLKKTSNGFIVKLIPIKYYIYGIKNDGNKDILETSVARSYAKEKIKFLNNQEENQEYIEFDCDIERVM